ncbi:hypothetical protein [Croceivirga radicis]|uniref:Uncharacterized protein n=1 Tax=Croceivirga radicis TaxID=1929488 RepID=A0A1V6LVK6_9FLAO|nr:hypothetical protein [Croceivirga radicis]OQD44046.1 hypothetical protein BUL40_00375 [Croceivirga radicis]
MKAATLAQLKKELQHLDREELLQFCLRLGRFKLENKELITYLLFYADDEDGYMETVKQQLDNQFAEINTTSYFYIKKSVRKIVKGLKKNIRYSGKKETEAELLLYFCKKLLTMKPSIKRNKVLTNTYERQLALAQKKISGLHEDLQYDLNLLLEDLKSF